jgi:Alpha/beta hydrolase domain containing 18
MSSPHRHESSRVPLCVFRRRKYLAQGLLEDGVGTLILEGPYYNTRKPPGQLGSKLAYVADIVKLGAATIVEALWLAALLRSAGVAVRLASHLLLAVVVCGPLWACALTRAAVLWFVGVAGMGNGRRAAH